MFVMSRNLVCASLLAMIPVVSQAAGTYYNSKNYQSRSYVNMQKANNNAAVNAGYTPYGNTNARYSVGTNVTQQRVPVQQNANTQVANNKSKGFTLDAGFAHQFAEWNFEMKNAGSMLHYDNLHWNVLSANAGYVFDNDTLPFQIGAGVQYGFQSGESTMLDDDISNGGYGVANLVGDDGGVVAQQVGSALSVGTSKSGNMLGFNAEVGLTDVFSIGKLKITPSIGYRYLKYKLKTTNNNGMALDTMISNDSEVVSYCQPASGGEVQCAPILIGGGLVEYSGLGSFKPNGVLPGDLIDLDSDEYADIFLIRQDGEDYIDTAGTYRFEQPGTSHDYEVTWSGPYVAMGMEYEINSDNRADMRVELGLPGYESVGDQPYRIDWQHPKSVEDKASMFSGLHLGLAANWNTAITDRIDLSLGVTYDYYSINKADATTYMDQGYWLAQYAYLYETGETSETNSTMQEIEEYERNGWKSTLSNEIKSVYKSLGARIGISARF